MLSHMVVVFLIFSRASRLFLRTAETIYILPTLSKIPLSTFLSARNIIFHHNHFPAMLGGAENDPVIEYVYSSNYLLQPFGQLELQACNTIVLVTCISPMINDVKTLFLYMFSISVHIIVLCVVYMCMFACVGTCVHECTCLHRMWQPEVGIGGFSCLFSTLYTKKSFSYLTLNSVI